MYILDQHAGAHTQTHTYETVIKDVDVEKNTQKQTVNLLK